MPSKPLKFGSIADCLWHHINHGDLKFIQIARAGGISEPTARRWADPESGYGPDVPQMGQLIDRLPHAVSDDLEDLLPRRRRPETELPACSLGELIVQIARCCGDAHQKLVANAVQAAEDNCFTRAERAACMSRLNELGRQVSRAKRMIPKTRGKN